ncbi:hypothetical protein [Asanoa iriomotensis]|uniref:LPXTG-motif cell wall-anchored protein n=1 Tax=Asanoa iriomotensis TaxID=234613 RepID=A0ABQ4C153_9ACTN|nr:hypothetical protein [Asanoa iriomotensis]GIF56511.1 hypothetical protein Air01nite_26060 [Asanoa iriomotensis]
MSMTTARRLLAGLAAAGAFVAATALPAHAAPGIEIDTADLLVAPDFSAGGELRVRGQTGVTGEISVVIDSTALDVADVDVSGSGWDCDVPRGTMIRCVVQANENTYFETLRYQVYGHPGAALGSTGTIALTASNDGTTVSGNSVVTIAQASNLAAGPPVAVTADPGGVATANQPVSNVGGSTVEGSVLVLSPLSSRTRYRGDFGNCVNYGDYFVVCAFSQPLEAGRNYALSDELPYAVDRLARTGAVFHVASTWYTEADWDLIKDSWIGGGVPATPGAGAAVRLEETANARRAPQTDTDISDNSSSVDITVGGNQPVDLAATGGTIPQDTIDPEGIAFDPAFRNLGPAILEQQPQQDEPIVRIVFPEGVVGGASTECAPYSSGDPWPPAPEAFGRGGAREYGCLVFGDVNPGDTVFYSFLLRIERVVPGAKGMITVKVAGDSNPANDSAEIVLGPAPGGGGGGGGLPVTGPVATVIGSVGALLIAAGATGFILFRRRRTRFVA